MVRILCMCNDSNSKNHVYEAGSILPIPKIPSPLAPSNYRPISITPVLYRLLERIVVTDYIYPSFQAPPPNLSFLDQFAFQPTASSTAALIHPLRTITTLLQTNHYVIVYALDFSVIAKVAQMKMYTYVKTKLVEMMNFDVSATTSVSQKDGCAMQIQIVMTTVSDTVLYSTNICSWKCQTTSIIG